MLGIFFADGFEEIEALATVDVLRRAMIDVTTISVKDGKEVTGGHGVTILTDAILTETDFDGLSGIILPGGNPGFLNLEKCDALMEKVVSFSKDKDKLVAAICGAPSLLGHKGIVSGKTATIYPGMERELTGAKAVKDKAVTDGNVITSRGAGTAIDFALEIVKYYKGASAAKDVAEKIVFA